LAVKNVRTGKSVEPLPKTYRISDKNVSDL